MQTDIH